MKQLAPALCLVAILLAYADLHAEPRRHHAADYVATGAFAATAIGFYIAPRGETTWRAGNDFDDGFRDAFGLHNHGDRTVAARVSDVTLIALLSHRLLIDNAMVTWAGHGDGDLAWQMVAIDLQALAFTLAAASSTKLLTKRERPSGRACRTDPRYDRRCEAKNHDGSFFSGHTSLAFTAASLTCTQHLENDIYGGYGDPIACVAAMFAASTVGFERLLADRHYASDVLVGAAVGVLSGAVLPQVSFYARPMVLDSGVDSGGGLIIQGVF